MHGNEPVSADVFGQLRRFGDFEIPGRRARLPAADGYQSHGDVIRAQPVGQLGVRDAIARMVNGAITKPHQITEIGVAAQRRPVERVVRGRRRIDAVVQILHAQPGIGGHHALVADADRMRMLSDRLRDDQFRAPRRCQDRRHRTRIKMIGMRVRAQNQAGMSDILRAQRCRYQTWLARTQ